MSSEKTSAKLENAGDSNRPQKQFTDISKTTAFIIVFVVAVVGFSGLYVYKYFRYEAALADAKASVDFKEVTGKVTSSIVRELDTRRSSFFEPKVEYEYSIEDRHYHSEQIMFPNPAFSFEREARVYVGRYPAGSAVQVYYDPAKPEKSCLEKGITFMLKDDMFFKPH